MESAVKPKRGAKLPARHSRHDLMAVTSLLDPAGVSAEAVLGAMRAVALEHGGPG